MDINIVKEKLTKAIKMLFKNDNYLLKNDIHERSITHKLAEYIQKEFEEYHVDCEYNGNIKGSEEENVRKILISRIITQHFDSEEVKKVYPDIIVHKRGYNKNNLILIEVKKSSNTTNNTFDLEKLRLYTKKTKENPYGYKYGIFLKFQVGERNNSLIEDIWFQAGNEETQKLNSISEYLKNN